jgi:hypothetical protein
MSGPSDMGIREANPLFRLPKLCSSPWFRDRFTDKSHLQVVPLPAKVSTLHKLKRPRHRRIDRHDYLAEVWLHNLPVKRT